MTKSEQLAQRIVACLPAATYEMETFCRLLSIETSEKIPSASVECSDRPRLLINPDFVEQFCYRDEHLFLLVMHELWHILLGHTKVYPRATLADNIAFDAIINAGLAHQFSDPEYRGFLESINAPNVFPQVLLRPPLGFPDAPEYPPDDIFPAGTTAILHRLYNPKAGFLTKPLYQEIRDLLESAADYKNLPVLLGNHAEEDLLEDESLRDIIKRIIGAWPPPPYPLQGRSTSGELDTWKSTIGLSSDLAVRRVFGQILRRCLRPHLGSYTERQRQKLLITTGTGVLPNPRDRLRPARKRLKAGSLLWLQDIELWLRIPAEAIAHVYFDVSGSMFSLLPHLIGLVLPYVQQGQARVFQFSGVVEPLTLQELKEGNLKSSRGTDINPVLEHLQQEGIRRALILTDGCVGVPREDYMQYVKQNGIALYVALPHESNWVGDLQAIATSLTILPPLE